MLTHIIVAFTVISAMLPSIATVRVQRKEHKGQIYVLGISAGICGLMILGLVIKQTWVFWLAVILATGWFLFNLLAPIEWLNALYGD